MLRPGLSCGEHPDSLSVDVRASFLFVEVLRVRAFVTKLVSEVGMIDKLLQKKPQEFDGKVSWEVYWIQFEMLADHNDWDEGQSAVQLATSLKGPALEVLGQLLKADRNRYSALAEVLNRKYGTMCQSEMYRARFRTRVRARGEPLQKLAQDLESTEQFIDALYSIDLKVQVKQTRPGTMQEALARAMEFESYVKSSTGNFRVSGSSGFKARRVKVHEVEGLGNSRKLCEQKEEMTGVRCWHCGRSGHRWRDCYSWRREKKQNDRAGSVFKGECWSCKEKGHLRYVYPTRNKESEN
uniref:CCHC-type domain-containing protein n=1 Tax=Octopus bimaculoides TaxID=37653 RepID=A0A0L8FGB1_OCTBM